MECERPNRHESILATLNQSPNRFDFLGRQAGTTKANTEFRSKRPTDRSTWESTDGEPSFSGIDQLVSSSDWAEPPVGVSEATTAVS